MPQMLTEFEERAITLHGLLKVYNSVFEGDTFEHILDAPYRERLAVKLKASINFHRDELLKHLPLGK